MTLKVLVRIHNNGDLIASLLFESAPNTALYNPEHSHSRALSNVNIDGRQELPLEIHVERPLREWAAITDWLITTGDEEAEFRSKHDFDLNSHFYFNWLTVGETGAFDQYHLKLSGSPLLAVPNETGAWQIGNMPNDVMIRPGVIPFPRKRIYFLSRSDDLQLPAWPDPRGRRSDALPEKELSEGDSPARRQIEA